MSQKVLILTTSGGSLRSDVEGWTVEDSALYVHGKPIGLTPSPTTDLSFSWKYDNVLQALNDGWKLLNSPQRLGDGYVWWLTRE